MRRISQLLALLHVTHSMRNVAENRDKWLGPIIIRLTMGYGREMESVFRWRKDWDYGAAVS